jgi:hypothetical protein
MEIGKESDAGTEKVMPYEPKFCESCNSYDCTDCKYGTRKNFTGEDIYYALLCPPKWQKPDKKKTIRCKKCNKPVSVPSSCEMIICNQCVEKELCKDKSICLPQ